MISTQAKECRAGNRCCAGSFVLSMVGLVLLMTATVADARTIVCESHDRRQQYCPVDTRGGVRLVRQLSRDGCYEGQSWGYDRHGIWVSRGCRAQFEVGSPPWQQHHGPQPDDGYRRYDHSPPHRHAVTITCESWDGRRNFCRTPFHRGGVEVQRQLSKAPCRYGQTWGWNDRGIWVQGGCRAVFVIY